MGSRTLRHSQSQQNMQTISETPAEAFARVKRELFGLLTAASGEESLYSGIGAWRQRVSGLIAQAFEIAQTALQGGGGIDARPFVQVGYLTTDIVGGVPTGSGQVGVVENGDVIFNGDAFGSLPYAGGVFTLEPNTNYLLSATFQLGYSDADSFARIFWVEANTNTVLRAGVGEAADGGYEAVQYSGMDKAQLLITTGDTPLEVKLRVLSITTGTIDILYGSNALIHEI